MTIEDGASPQKLALRRIQTIETDDGLLLKRGRVVVKIEGAEAAEVAQAVLAVAAEGDATRDELCDRFPPTIRAAVKDLIDALHARRLLADASSGDGADVGPEEPVDIFYWHFGKSRAEIEQGISGSKLVVLGVNCVSRQLVSALGAAGVASLDVVDYPLLGNVRLFDEDGVLQDEAWPRGAKRPIGYREWLERDGARGAGCIVATSDFGGQHLLRHWNRHCVREHVHFLPVVLQDLVGYVGPLVIPGESACLECVRARENSHMTDPETRRAAEYVAYAGQVVNGFHPSMASILGDIAAIEIVKLYGHIMRSRLVGRMLEVNLLAPQITERRVLRVPRCTVCGMGTGRSPVSQDKNISMPGHEVLR